MTLRRSNPGGGSVIASIALLAVGGGLLYLVRDQLGGIIGIAPGGGSGGSGGSGSGPRRPPGTTPGGGSTSVPPNSRPPAGTSTTSGTAATPGTTALTPAGEVVEVSFYGDIYEYPVGTTLTLYGWVTVNGQNAGGRLIQVVDPDAGANGTAWLEAMSDVGGYWAVQYTDTGNTHWRSYAYDTGSGARTGNLEFWPFETVGDSGDASWWWCDLGGVPTGSPADDPGRDQLLYDDMAAAWARWSPLVEARQPALNRCFHHVWTEVADRISNGTGIGSALWDRAVAAINALEDGGRALEAGG